MCELGVDVQFYTINQIKSYEELQDIPAKYLNSIVTSINRVNSPSVQIHAPVVKIYHQFALDMFPGKGEHIGFPFFELDTFNQLEQTHLKSVDKMFVASNWAKQVMSKYYNESQIHVIPLGVDSTIFKPTHNHNKTTTFTCIGKWEKRKNQAAIIAAFNSAFTLDDNVTLWLCCDNPCYPPINEDFKNLVRSTKLANKIQLIPRRQTQNEVAEIIKLSSCGVFPSRAEGWNLELLEFMSMGKPVITTNYSAHTEFCNSSNSYLIEPQSMELAEDGIWFNKQGSWMEWTESNQQSLIELMKNVHLTNQAGLVYNDAGVKTAEQFSWKQTALKILENLS